MSALRQVSIPTAFETVNFGSGLGTFPAAFQGALEPDLAVDDDDPNLRFTSETNSRVTDSEIFALGGEWQGDRLSVRAEIASTSADTNSPTFNTTLKPGN